MNDQLLALLACPRCRAAFASFADSVRCTACGANFPVIADIPRLNDGATERDPKVAAEWEAQLHAHALYADRHSIVNRLEEQVLPRLVEWLGTVTPPVLDVGCGVGHFGRTWAASGRVTAPLLGIDLQVRLLADARSGYIGLVEGDVHRLPLRSASFGAVVFANALHHVSEPVRALEQVRRVLRPGGVVVTCDPREISVIELAKKILRRNSDAFTKYHRAFRPAAYRRLFDQAGLHVERLEVVDPFGPLLATGLDLIKAGRLGVATPVAKVLAGMDRMVARADPTSRFGLIVLARAKRGTAVP